MRYGKLSFSGDTVQLWLEGLPPNDNEVMVDFIHIQTMDDFIKAFNQTFSKVPLQDEHQEWPAEVRQAIGERKLIAGMTEEQAFSVVDAPVKVTTAEENGAKADAWFPRQNKGFVTAWGQTEGIPTGFPVRLLFMDGKLQMMERTPGPDTKGN